MLVDPSESIDRRAFLRSGVKAGLAMATASTLVFPSIARAEHNPSPTGELDVYLPNWLTDEDYGKLQDLKLKNVSRFVLAFALPESNGGFFLPTISPGIKALLSSSRSTTKVGLSVGGWGSSNAQHTSNLKGFGSAINNPKAFVESAKKAVAELGLDQIDIDIEFPTSHQAGKPLSDFTHELRKGLPSDVSIGMAVSPNNLSNPTIADYEFGEQGLDVDTFHVMTYDENGGTGNQPAGYVASGSWTIKCINEWVKRVGDPSKIMVGFPTYGYQYTGATKAGETFKTAAQVLYPHAPKSTLANNYKDLTSSGKVGTDGWASFETPNVMQRVYSELIKAHPKLGGAFLWSAEGLIQAHIDALVK